MSTSTPASSPTPVGATTPALLRDWPQAALLSLEREPVIVRVLVAQVRGSAPREPGAGMLVGAERVEGSIGGGQLEWQALAAARTLLAQASGAAVRLQRLVLGTDLSQCCGGVVELWLERLTRADVPLLRAAREAAGAGPTLLRSTLVQSRLERELLHGSQASEAVLPQTAAHAQAGYAAPRLVREADGRMSLIERLDGALPPVWLYGAGHVGQALARLLIELPLSLTWIDARGELFPASLPVWVRILPSDPLASLAEAPAGTHYRVLTHSHALDYALCRAVLARGDCASLGLIGSDSKAARFRSRLARDGIEPARIAQLICPIGVPGIQSKWPAAIALSAAAQLLQQLGGEAIGSDRAARDRAPSAPAEPCGRSDCEGCAAHGAPGRRASA